MNGGKVSGHGGNLKREAAPEGEPTIIATGVFPDALHCAALSGDDTICFRSLSTLYIDGGRDRHSSESP